MIGSRHKIKLILGCIQCLTHVAKREIGSIVMVPGQQQPFSLLPGRQSRPIRAPSTTKDSLIKN